MSVRPATSANVFLDANAGAPLRPEVIQALRSALSGEFLPNPSSQHGFGRKAKAMLNEAREHVARSFGHSLHPEQILFTSSGTESSQTALRSALEPALLRGEKVHWITTPVEHDATLSMIPWVEARGGQVSFLPVNSDGQPDPLAIAEQVRPETKLVSCIWVNNETGVISDVSSVARETSRLRIPLHLDGAQAWGKLSLALDSMGASWVSFSGSKIGALPGTGVLWRSARAGLTPLMHGTQESKARGGTENLAGIVSLGAAALALSPETWARRVTSVRKNLEAMILREIPDVMINGARAPRIANTISLSFKGIGRQGLVQALDLAGFSVSAGSACSSGVGEPSHVLQAMGHSRDLASASLRISLADELSLDASESFVRALSQSVLRMRASV